MLVVALVWRQRTVWVTGSGSRWTLLDVQRSEPRVRSPCGAQQLPPPVDFPKLTLPGSSGRGGMEGGPRPTFRYQAAQSQSKSPCESSFSVRVPHHAPLTPTDSWGDKNSPVKKSAEPLGKSGTEKVLVCSQRDANRARKLERREHTGWETSLFQGVVLCLIFLMGR